MKTWNACGAHVTPSLIRFAISDVLREYRMLPAKAVMHPVQSIMLDNCAIQIKETYFTREMLNAESSITMAKTCAGIPLVEDVREPNSRIQFKDADDKVLAEIVCLAIPIGLLDANT